MYTTISLQAFYSLVMGQCTELMKDKLEARTQFEPINQSQNGIALLGLIRLITYTYDENIVKQVDVLGMYKEDYFALKRQWGQSLDDFYKTFCA